MTPAATLLPWGVPAAVLVCFCVWAQRASMRRPAKTPAQAQARAVALRMAPLSQLGVRIGADGFVYANATNRCLGPAAAATAEIIPRVPVGKVKPGTGWAVITFAGGTRHRALFATRNLPLAKTQADRFNTLVKDDPGQPMFRRTWQPPAETKNQRQEYP